MLALRRSALLLLFTGLLFPARPAGAYTALHAFGDSLTDTYAFLLAWPPDYADWKFSNGPLWVEHLSPRLGFAYVQANNHAAAGSTTSGALSQANNLSPPTNAGSALFTLWSGGNDFLNGLSQGTNETYWANLIATAVHNLSNTVTVLVNKGARSILVPNLPDLGNTPRMLNGYSPAFQVYLTGKTRQFNTVLATTLDRLRLARPTLQLFSMDVFTRMTFIRTNLAIYGFTTFTRGALQDPALADKSFGGPGRNYVFWDEIHPTSKAHALIADWAVETLNAAQGIHIAHSRGGSAMNLILQNLETARTYTLQLSTSLPAWLDVERFMATNGTRSVSVPLTTHPHTFYRVKH